MQDASPFALPAQLAPSFAALRDYWEGLKRNRAQMPFADDVSPPALSSLAPQLIILDVFDKPLRYRFASVGADITRRYGEALDDRFVEEIKPKPPLAFLAAQCSATIEIAGPTYLENIGDAGYSRLLLPLWGEGRIQMILGLAG